MRDITVNRKELLAKVKDNRTSHRDTFQKAQDKYRIAVIAELDKKLNDAKEGRVFDQFIRLPVPEDHTPDYDRVIGMLEMDVREQIELTETDFGIYVMDQWQWKQAWANTTLSYVGK